VPGLNDLLHDAFLSHQVDLQQYSTGVVRQIVGLLNKVDADLVAQLQAALADTTPDTFKVSQLEHQLAAVRSITQHAYQLTLQTLAGELRMFAEAEADWNNLVYQLASPTRVVPNFVRIEAAQVYAAAIENPFRGRLLSQWSQSLSDRSMDQLRDAVAIGYTEGQTTSQIIGRIRGTKAAGYADGVLQMRRRDAEAVARTAVSHLAQTARSEVERNNRDLIKAVRWVSTLDGRTTPECRLRDGKLFTPEEHKPVGHKVPWLEGPGRLHWRCRSTSVPVLKSFRDLGLDMDEPKGTRASEGGQVAADMSYADWLKAQSAARQDEILGPTRGKLMREGKMPFDSFYTDRGIYMTLDQLRARNAAAFKRAGL